jgi:hypothetical protein
LLPDVDNIGGGFGNTGNVETVKETKKDCFDVDVGKIDFDNFLANI